MLANSAASLPNMTFRAGFLSAAVEVLSPRTASLDRFLDDLCVLLAAS